YWSGMTLAASLMMVWAGYPYTQEITGIVLASLYWFIYPLVPAFILYFMVLYPDEKRLLIRHSFLHYVIFIPSILFIILLEATYLPAVISKSIIHYRIFYHGYNAYRAYLVLSLSIGIGCMIHSYLKSDSKPNRNKIQWILWGICMGAGPILFLWTLPIVLGYPPLISEESSHIFLMIIPVSFAFSIVKYRAMNIEIIINRSIVYTIITGIVVGVYLIVTGLVGHIFQVVSQRTEHFLLIGFTLLAAVLFSPLRNKIQAFVDKTFYRVKYNYQMAIRSFSESLTTARTVQQVANILLNKIHSVIPVKKMGLIQRTSSGAQFTVSASLELTEEEKKDLQFAIARHLVEFPNSKRDLYVYKEPGTAGSHESFPGDAYLDAIGIKVLIPISLQKNLAGFLALGEKMSKARYSDEDLELILPMAEEGFTALERLRLQEIMILERAEKAKLKELDNLKSEFLSHVSHELRTPLTAMRWSVENLLDGIPEKPSPKIRTYLENTLESCQHLNRMIENLLDVSKIEAGKIDIHINRLQIDEEIRKSLEFMKSHAALKGITFNEKIPEGIWIQADKDWLRAVLINLVENAIKFSPESSQIEIMAKLIKAPKKTSGESVRMAAISVTDYGPGISKDEQEEIFKQFKQIKEGKTDSREGLGLGLHIVKKLVTLQGGDISVKSQINKGSTFTFTLPVA
ncbi:ATP-binding protein, partial [bacterium]